MEYPKQVYGRTVIGWREWASFPQLGIPAIKFKTDTGAKTSCLHTFEQELFTRGGKEWIKFGVHPVQKNTEVELFCEAPVIDFRKITNSGGFTEKRPIITTQMILGNRVWEIELSLTNRDSMKFRMLLGRTAMNDKIVVDPARSYVTGNTLANSYDN